MRLLLSAALLALTAATAHGQTVGGNAYRVLLATPLVVVDETPFVALPAAGGQMQTTVVGRDGDDPVQAQARWQDAAVHVLLTTPRPGWT